MTNPIAVDNHGDPCMYRDAMRAAATAALKRNPLATHDELIGAAFDAVAHGNVDVVNGYLRECILWDVRAVMNKVESVPIEGHGPRIASTNGHAPPAGAVAVRSPRKVSGSWKGWLTDDKVPARLKLMTREEVLTQVERLKDDGLGTLKQAALLSAIADGLQPGERVKDRYGDDALRSLLAEVDARAGWVRVEAAALAAGDEQE